MPPIKNKERMRNIFDLIIKLTIILRLSLAQPLSWQIYYTLITFTH